MCSYIRILRAGKCMQLRNEIEWKIKWHKHTMERRVHVFHTISFSCKKKKMLCAVAQWCSSSREKNNKTRRRTMMKQNIQNNFFFFLVAADRMGTICERDYSHKCMNKWV